MGDGPTPIEIGWTLHPEVRGHGYATEAATAVVERARAGDLQEVHALVYTQNSPSVAVCQRLGMTNRGLSSEWYGVEAQDYLLVL